MLARQLRRDPNPDAIEDAACALEALAIEGERPPGAPGIVSGGESGRSRPKPVRALAAISRRPYTGRMGEERRKPPVTDRPEGKNFR